MPRSQEAATQTTDPDLLLKALLHESDHVQGAIARMNSTIHTLFGLTLPGVLALALYSASNESTHLPIDVLGIAISGIVTIALLYSNGLWIELFKYAHYKYAVLHPRISEVVGCREEPNFAQHLARTTESITWLPTIVFQLMTLTLVGTFSIAIIFTEAPPERKAWLIAGSASLTLVASASGLLTAYLGRRITDQIGRSSPIEAAQSPKD